MDEKKLAAIVLLVSLMSIPIAGVTAPALRPGLPQAQSTATAPRVRLNLGPVDPTIDPAMADGWSASTFVANQLFLGLVRVDDETGAPILDLATSWVMSQDATVFTFTLRSGATWTDGNPVTAYDVHYGILRSLDPSTASPYPLPLFVIENAKEFNQGVITDTDLVGVTVLDYTHVRFTLEQAAAYLPSVLALPIARTMPAWAIAAHPSDWTEPANIVTNGPYSLIAWTHGLSMTLEKNPDYYDAANVQIGQVLLHMVDDTTAWAMYQAGQLDSAVVPPDEWGSVSEDPLLRQQLHTASRLGTFYYGFNTAAPPFDNVLVRKAFVAAVDRQGIIDDITQYAEQPALTFTPPGLLGHVDGFSAGVGIPYDPAQAQQWLAAAGYPGGQGLPTVTLMFDTRFYTTNLAIASTLRQSWMDVLSATVIISQTDWASYLALLQTDPPPVWQLRWIADQYDAQNFLRDGVDGLGRLKYGNWSNPAYEGLLGLSARTGDLDTRRLLYEQAEEILVETDGVMFPIYYFGHGLATRPYLQRTYGAGGYGERVADWRITWRVFLPLVVRDD